MADPRQPSPQDELAAYNARMAPYRRRRQAGLLVPDEWEGFVDVIREMFVGLGFLEMPDGLQAARLWSYLRTNTPAGDASFSLEDALDAGFLLDLGAEAVGRALDLLRHAELVAGTPEGFVTFNPAVPF
jgi:hypothetical protein